ncbi:hypothetical protein BT96DRAFT_823255 [Gymnopus androsaceus JB14]|uniref:G-protein coupled receptors family 1 profile domain-containing protein n=1 Tax=Gymnopus androsaceus JB14 TaxID=1447944 RepID=A0A6A4HGA2_9AGAR|nr:hypothetical protein BT96DRAFT_823251 [Gymnopus androsaceus JB14]KAE9397519.1 hypothetical protein BT96DRAFT_823255 [Gymnopus androsaceus JB14]
MYTVGKVFAANTIIVLTMYIITLSLWIIGLVDLLAEVKKTLIDSPGQSLQVKKCIYVRVHVQRSRSNRRTLCLLEPSKTASQTLLGDVVIVWRVRAVWALGRSKSLNRFITHFICHSATSVVLTFCVVDLGGDIIDGSFQKPAFCRNMQTASYTLPTVTTAVTTIFIGMKAWSYYRNSAIRKRTHLVHIMTLLLESGLVYFLFFMAQIVLPVPSVRIPIEASSGLTLSTLMFSYQTSSIVGMYPTAIICLVHSRHSMAETSYHSA